MPASRSLNPIDNVHVKGFAFPLPGASHTRYLAHRRVIALLWDVIIKGHFSYVSLPVQDKSGKQGKDYDSVLLRPGAGRGERWWLQGLAIALPWAILAAIALAMFAGLAPQYGLAACSAIAAVLGLAALRSILQGPLDPY
jgi:hypothetical protein